MAVGADASRGTGLTVLLIEDSASDRELIVHALRRLPAALGPVTIRCADGWETARPLLAADVDLVLVDHRLPPPGGLDVLHGLHGRPHPPIVVLTGRDGVATAVETLRAGAAEYVQKSADVGPSLGPTIERVVERARLERELAAARAEPAAHARALEREVASRTAVIRAQAAEIEGLYLQAEEAARLEAEIVSNVSHELRTPLNVILGYAELLEEKLAATHAPTDAVAMLGKVRRQAEELHRLVESLLAMRRLTAGAATVARARFRLADVADDLRREAAAWTADRGVPIEWAVDAAGEVEHDRDKVRAIAYHLLHNALEFTPAGRIGVTLASPPGGGVRVTVADAGIGISPEDRGVAFDALRHLDGSATRRYEGLGLGIVKRYATLLGGTIAVDGGVGRGTTVTVALPPLAPPRAAAGARRA